MVEIIQKLLYGIDHHFGAISAIILAFYLVFAYTRGEMKEFFSFLREMLEGADGKASSKNAGYFMGAAVLCWSYMKMTLAICRAIDAARFEPSTVFIVLLSAITALVGGVVLGASAIQARLRAKLETQDPSLDKDQTK